MEECPKKTVMEYKYVTLLTDSTYLTIIKFEFEVSFFSIDILITHTFKQHKNTTTRNTFIGST